MMKKFIAKVNKKKSDPKFDVIKEDLYADWIFKEELGKGAFGSVYLYSLRQKYVAIKEFENSDDGEYEFNLELEAFRRTFSSGEGHDHVVRFIAAFQTCSGYRIALEYFQQGTLKDIWIRCSHYNEEDVRDIIMQVASGLNYMRLNKVAHRDIKPANILVKSYRPIHVAVADLNFAKASKDENYMTVFQTNLGTPGYKAPEVTDSNLRKNSRSYNHKCDIWSLGMIAYELLSGKYRPFEPSLDEVFSIRDACASEKDLIMFEIDKLGTEYLYADDLQFRPNMHWQTITDVARELVREMLRVDYKQRIDYPGILAHPWKEATDCGNHPLYDEPAYHHYESKIIESLTL